MSSCKLCNNQHLGKEESSKLMSSLRGWVTSLTHVADSPRHTADPSSQAVAPELRTHVLAPATQRSCRYWTDDGRHWGVQECERTNLWNRHSGNNLLLDLVMLFSTAAVAIVTILLKCRAMALLYMCLQASIIRGYTCSGTDFRLNWGTLLNLCPSKVF